MSAPVAAEVLRELRAEARQFRSVQAALLWYVEQRAQREGRAISIEPGCSGRSRASIDEINATYARIASCLTPRHAGDADGNHLAFSNKPQQARREAGFRVRALALYYSSAVGRSKTSLLDSLGDVLNVGPRLCERYVLYAESVLRCRMRSVGLIP